MMSHNGCVSRILLFGRGRAPDDTNMLAFVLRDAGRGVNIRQQLGWVGRRPNSLMRRSRCGFSAGWRPAIVSSRFYSAGTANGSSGDGLTLSCRGFPIKTG